MDAGEVDVGDAAPVQENQRVLRPGDAEAAQVDRGDRAVVAVKVRHRDADLLGKKLGQRARRAFADILRGDDRGARGQAARVLRKARRGNHDRVVVLRKDGRSEGSEGRYGGGHACWNPVHLNPFRCLPRHHEQRWMKGSKAGLRTREWRKGSRFRRVHAFP